MNRTLTDLALDLSTHRYDKETHKNKISEFMDKLSDVAIAPGSRRFAIREFKVSAERLVDSLPMVRIEIIGFDYEKLNQEETND